nr:ribosome maturation factor RimP [Actinomycetota bacterium]
VSVDRPGGVDLDELAQANRVVSAYLDEHDPVPGRYTLEVSSPGVERQLRRPEHFARAVGQTVQVKTRPGTGEVRRATGVLSASDDVGFVVTEGEGPDGAPLQTRFAYADVDRVRTVFTWGPGPKPGAAERRSTPTPKRKQVTTR